MTTRRCLYALGLLSALGLMLVAAGCASHHGAVGVHYGAHSGAHPSLVYGSSFYLGRGVYQVVYLPRTGYYFRTRALGPGRYCSRYCYSRGRDVFHHASCGRFGRVASFHHTHARSLIHRYGPR